MTLSQIILILKARYKFILATLVVFIVIATLLNFFLPKSYTSVATVLVNYKGADPVTGVALPAQLMPGYMATQVDIISSKNVAKKVVADLKLAENSLVQQNFQKVADGQGDINDWLAELLLKKLVVKPSKESSVINIEFEGTNPQFAAVVANAFAEAYIRMSIELKVLPSQKAADYFTLQIKELRDNLAKSQQKLSNYQQEKGIVSVDERLDVERARLSELSSQLVVAQAQLMEAQSRERNSSGSNALESPDVSASPLIQNLKSDIARAESRFAEISQKFERNHPMYLGAKAEIDNLKEELNRQVKLQSGTIATNSRILQQREAEIRAALNAQKEKVMKLNRDRDELAVLTREVENAQHAYDMVMQRYTQTNFEGQSNQSDISILNYAIPAIEPSSPKVFLNLLLAIVLGLMSGIGLALGVEMLDKRIRSSNDLVDVLGLPVLGELKAKKTKYFRPAPRLLTLSK